MNLYSNSEHKEESKKEIDKIVKLHFISNSNEISYISLISKV